MTQDAQMSESQVPETSPRISWAGVPLHEDVHAVFNGWSVAIWVEDGPVLLDLTVDAAKKLKNLLGKAIREAE